LKFNRIANQPVIGLILPKRLSGEAEHLVRSTGRESLERLHDLGSRNGRSDQQVDMIGHHHVSMERVLAPVVGAILDRFHNHGGELRPAQVERAGSGLIQQSVHDHERLARAQWGDKDPVGRQTAVKTPREKDGLVDFMKMRQAAPEACHMRIVKPVGGNSQ
jgi:hypothetical protein